MQQSLARSRVPRPLDFPEWNARVFPQTPTYAKICLSNLIALALSINPVRDRTEAAQKGFAIPGSNFSGIFTLEAQRALELRSCQRIRFV